MRESAPPRPQYVLMAWCLVKHRDNYLVITSPKGVSVIKILTGFSVVCREVERRIVGMEVNYIIDISESEPYLLINGVVEIALHNFKSDLI
jgi:hypothetical protein